MYDARFWQGVLQKLTEARPHNAVALASATQRLHPVLPDLCAETAQPDDVAWYGKVIQVTAPNSCQPVFLFADSAMSVTIQPVLHAL